MYMPMMPFPNIMSVKRPAKKPTYMPSFLPFIKPKALVKKIMRLGFIPPKERALKMVHCSTKKRKVKRTSRILLFIKPLILALL